MRVDKIPSLLILSALAMLLIGVAGCATPPIPGATRADATMKRDVYQTISQMESADGGSFAPSVIDTQGVAYDARAKTGREIWTVRRGEATVRYEVSTVGNANGGTDFAVRKLPAK